MQLQIPDPVQLSTDIPSHLDCLVYGYSGTGKTELAGGFETPILFLDSDGGILTVKTSPRISDNKKAEIYQVPISDKSPDPHYKKPVGFLTVKAVLQEVSEKGEFSGITPTTIVVDSLTTLSEMCMTYVLDQNGKPKTAQPTLPDYQRQMKELLDIVHYGVACPCHFICIAHQQFTKDENTGRLWCLPLVTGKLAYNVTAYFDEVYYAQSKEVGGKFKYTLLTKPNGLVVAKSRLDLPTEIPTSFGEINNILQKLRTSAKQAQANAAQKGGGGTQQAAQALGIKP